MSEKRLNRKDFYLIVTVCFFCLAMAALLTRGKYLYGSETDWISQHAVFPEYFRNLFYETGEFFPSLAPNIGAGENIYHFSYYGLYSPVILLSYLLPFVSMTAYLMAASLISALLSVILFYLWIRKRFDRATAFVLDLMLAFSGPLLMHSHRHIMFVIYLPFLIAALHFVDRFFEKGRVCGLAVSTALIIFTSYYFSVPAIAAITIYAIFRFAERRETENRGKLLPDLVKSGGIFAGLILVAILFAGVLLLPTARVLLGGRDAPNVSVGWQDLLPTINTGALTFDPYSLGLSSFLILAIIDQLLYGKPARRFLAIIFAAFLTCPILLYLFGGFEYLDGKVLIPFLPAALLLCGSTLRRLLDGSFRIKTTLPIFGVVSLLGLVLDRSRYHRRAYLADLLLVIVCVLICTVRRGKIPQIKSALYAKCALPLALIVPLAACVVFNIRDSLTPIADYEVENADDLYALFDDLAEIDPDFYRTAVNIDAVNTPNKTYSAAHYSDTVYSSLHDRDYNHFAFEEMGGENSYRNRAILSRIKSRCFNLYMSDKYWITGDGGYVPAGYTEVAHRGSYRLYRTDDALPLGYATDALMSRAEYERLPYPDRIEALLSYTVVEQDLPDCGFAGSMQAVDISGIFGDCPFLTKTEGGYRFVRSLDPEKTEYIYRYTLPEAPAGGLVMLRFTVDNTVGDQAGDVKIWVNGVANKLTRPDWKYYNHNESFEYAVTLRGESGRDLVFRFPETDYAIRDVEIWLCDSSMLTDLSGRVDAFVRDPGKTGGDEICGNIHVTADGYFNLSFVYSEGYRVYVDGNAVEPERVDSCFLGFPISAGDHEIRISYTAPGLGAGKALSGIGLVCLIGLAVCDLLMIRKGKRR